ncbi:MAG: C40 family peptidase [Calditrichaeota bacterium]|nr:C40 family peptidase [Calditrichota bacterium]
MIKKLFRKYFPALLTIAVISLLIFSCQANRELPNEVTQVIEQVKQKAAPDRRVTVFSVDGYRSGKKIILRGELLSPQAKKDLLDGVRAQTKLTVVDSLTVLPDISLGADTCGVIRVSVAQVRRRPDVNQEIITQGLLGTEVRLLKKRDGWYYLQLEDQYLGWVMRKSVAVGNIEFLNDWKDREKLVVKQNYGQVWENPAAKNSFPICDVVLGNRLGFVSKKGGYFRIELADGRTGFVVPELVEFEKKLNAREAPGANDLIRTAKQFMGIPYFWGGKSTKGFDCSGFTQTIYKWNGIQLPRDANMQVKIGTGIPIDDSLSQVKPGDLLFFGSAKDHITHVAMYLGGGRFIHSDGLVHINSLFPQHDDYSDYRKKHFQAARRILK